MKAYELMAALSALPCNAEVMLCNVTSEGNLNFNGCYEKNKEGIVFEVEVEKAQEEE